MRARLYGRDLAYIHHAGFGRFADEAAVGLLAMLRNSGIEGGRIIDLACGSGIWSARATGAGFDVLGVDISSAMIELARRVAPKAEFVVGSAYSVVIPPCVAVTAIGEGLGYVFDADEHPELATLLYRVADALVPGGLLIFDLVESNPGAPMNYEAFREGPDWSVQVRVVEDPVKRLLTRSISLTRRERGHTRHAVERHYLRTVDCAEVVDMLEAAGFDVQVTRCYGELELPPQRIGFVAKRIARIKRRCT